MVSPNDVRKMSDKTQFLDYFADERIKINNLFFNDILWIFLKIYHSKWSINSRSQRFIFQIIFSKIWRFRSRERCLQCPQKVLEQNKKKSHNFKKCINLKCPLQTIWIEDQAQRNVGPDLRSILFDTQHPFFAENWLYCVGLLEFMWLYKFCKFYKLFKNFWRAL